MGRRGGYHPGVPLWLGRSLKAVEDGKREFQDVVGAWVIYAIMAERGISRSEVGERLNISKQRVQQLIEINSERVSQAISDITEERHELSGCDCQLPTCGVMMSVGKEGNSREIAERIKAWTKERA